MEENRNHFKKIAEREQYCEEVTVNQVMNKLKNKSA